MTFSDWDSDPTHTTYKILELRQADFTSSSMVLLPKFHGLEYEIL